MRDIRMAAKTVKLIALSLFFIPIVVFAQGLKSELIRAINGHDTEAAMDLIAKDVDINVKDYAGMTPLVLALSQGEIEVANALITKGSDINAGNVFGVTPLMMAASTAEGGEKGDKIFDLLIAKGADVYAKDHSGMTVLMYAARGGHDKRVKTLLANGVDVNARVQNGGNNTALLLAAQSLGDHAGVIDLLLIAGADVNAKDGLGHTVLSRAEKKGRTDIIDLLKQAGAKG